MLAPSGIFGIVAGIFLLAAPAFAAPSADTLAVRDTEAGGVDLNAGCTQQYGGGWTANKSGNSANDWFCVDAVGNHKSINVDAACSAQYGNAAYANAGTWQGAYDWKCYWR